jgi:hypothetical protein
MSEQKPASSMATRVDRIVMQQLAAKYRLKLCQYCSQPLEVHTGFDRRLSQCELGTSNWSLGWIYQGNQKKVASILNRVNKFWREVESHICAGSGI